MHFKPREAFVELFIFFFIHHKKWLNYTVKKPKRKENLCCHLTVHLTEIFS